MSHIPLQTELASNAARVVAQTRHGNITGGRTTNGAAVFLEVPYALPPERFEDPKELPVDFRYEDKEYIKEEYYAVQPRNDGQVAHLPFESKVGLGKPSENPLFVNIVCPPSFPSTSGASFPVKVFIHGGALQFGSPHNLNSLAQYVSAERSEVWVNIGYRLSVFGFLACDDPKLEGNYGFKDQWLALQWVTKNISAFSGNARDIQLVGHSAGAHSVHQFLHHVSRLPPGQQSPFRSAVLQSNAILANPKTPADLRPQFRALCLALNLDPNSPDILATLRDPAKVPAELITHLIETDALGVSFGTFRGCLDGTWLSSSPDPMTWQRSGGLAQGLRQKGVQSVIIGDLSEEWYTFSFTNPVSSPSDVQTNLARYYPQHIVNKMLGMYGVLPAGAGEEVSRKLFGQILSTGQTHLPVRMLAKDLLTARYPVLRYEIRWTPERSRTNGYVTHGTDRDIWMLYAPVLEPAELTTARAWLDAVNAETVAIEKEGTSIKGVDEVLALKEDRTIEWISDKKWEQVMGLGKILVPE